MTAAVRIRRVRFKRAFVERLNFASQDTQRAVHDLIRSGVAAPQAEQPYLLGATTFGLVAEGLTPSATRH